MFEYYLDDGYSYVDSLDCTLDLQTPIRIDRLRCEALAHLATSRCSRAYSSTSIQLLLSLGHSLRVVKVLARYLQTCDCTYLKS